MADVQSLFSVVMESLNSNIKSILQTAPNINRAQEIITRHFHSSTYSVFQGFQMHATRMSYIKQNFGLVVSLYSNSV